MTRLVASQGFDMYRTFSTVEGLDFSDSVILLRVDELLFRYTGTFTYDDEGFPSGPVTRLTIFEEGFDPIVTMSLFEVDFATLNDAGIGNLFELWEQILPGDDKLLGSRENDLLDGWPGDDVIEGNAGDDDLLGWSGNDLVLGGPGDDRLLGYDYFRDERPSTMADADTLRGGDGDDLLFGRYDDDLIDGGPGYDRAGYCGDRSGYAVTLTDFGEATIRHRVAEQCGTDRLINVEEIDFLSFDAGDIVTDRQPLHVLYGATDASEAQMTTLVEMYIAYFDRAPDATGLYYWAARLTQGMTLEEIAASFFVQPESRTLFPDPGDDAALVDAVYANLLERAPDAAGRAYWIDALRQGDVSRPEFMLAVINGARADTGDPADARVVADKGKIGLYYAPVNGLTDVDNAADAMAAYARAAPVASLDAARALIDGYAAAADDPAGAMEFTVALAGVVADPFAA